MPKISINNTYSEYSVHQPTLFKYIELSVIIIVFMIAIKKTKKNIFYKS